MDLFVRAGCMVSSFLFSLALSRAYIGGRGGASFLVKIMYEYDCKLIRFHAVWSSVLGLDHYACSLIAK